MNPRPKRAPPVITKPMPKRAGAPLRPKPAAPSNRQARRAAAAKTRKQSPGASPVQSGIRIERKRGPRQGLSQDAAKGTTE